MASRWSRGTALGAVVVLLAAGCGSDDGGDAAGQSATVRPTATSPPSPSPSASGDGEDATTSPEAPSASSSASAWRGARELIANKGLKPYMQAEPILSGDGSRVAFSAAFEGAAESDVYVRNVDGGPLAKVSTTSSGKPADYAEDLDGDDGRIADVGSFSPSLSADGRTVAFASSAVNLVPRDGNRTEDAVTGFDVFVKDLRTGKVVMASTDADGVQGHGESTDPSISADGRKVAFTSTAADLVPGDTNGKPDVFVKDLRTGEITRVSVDMTDRQVDGASSDPVLSGDGGTVAFVSEATDLASDDTNSAPDVYVKTLRGGGVVYASRGHDGSGDGESDRPSLSSDGSVVAFSSSAALVEADTNGKPDVYVRDLRLDKLSRVSTETGGGQHPAGSTWGAVSGDGTSVVFVAAKPGLTDSDGKSNTDDVLVKDLRNDRTSPVADVFEGLYPRIADEADRVVFLDGTEKWDVHVVVRRG